MSRITDNDLEGKLKTLNSVMGYKGISWNQKQRKYTGKGFVINGAYGGVQVAFQNAAKGTGQRSVTYGYISKRELFDEMSAMIRAVQWYKQRTQY